MAEETTTQCPVCRGGCRAHSTIDLHQYWTGRRIAHHPGPSGTAVDYLECLACESSLLSSYINEHGVYYPCSFCEKQGDWSEGIDLKTCNDFIQDVWMHEKTNAFRKKLCANCRNCPMYEV